MPANKPAQEMSVNSKESEYKGATPFVPISWRQWQPEFLLIAGLLESFSTRETLERVSVLAKSLKEHGAKTPFTGLVSELGAAIAEVHAIAPLNVALANVFVAANRCLLRFFPFPQVDRLRDCLSLTPGDDEIGELAAVVSKSFGRRSGRATRTKFAWLFLSDGADRLLERMEKNDIGKLLLANDDEAEQLEIGSSVRALWGAYTMTRTALATGWSGTFWVHAALETPCPPPRSTEYRRGDVTAEHDRLIASMDDLWRGVIEKSPREPTLWTGEVVLGLATRIWRFVHHIAGLVKDGNGEMAEIAYRCQWDTYTTLRWILSRDAVEYSLRFQQHDARQMKSQLERVREQQKIEPTLTYLKYMERELLAEMEDFGTWDPLVREANGSWNGRTTKRMAQDIDAEMDYAILFARSSDIVHPSWRGLKRYHTQRCPNPLHQYHRVPLLGSARPGGISPLNGALGNAAGAIALVCELIVVDAEAAATYRQEVADAVLRWSAGASETTP